MFVYRFSLFLAASSMLTPVFAMDDIFPPQAADGWGTYARINLWEASDFLPTRKIEGDWNQDFSPKAGQNTSLRSYRAELGLTYKEWQLNMEARQEGVLQATASTLAFVKAYKQGEGGRPQEPVSYQLNAQMKSWSGFGLRMGRWFATGDAYQPRFFASAVYYMQPQYRSAQATGNASYSDNQHYSFSASEIDTNSRYQYLFRQFEPEARGYSSSIAMDWKINTNWRMQYKMDDVFNRFQWQHLPELQQSLNSAVVQYDSHGYLNYQPLLQGANRQADQSISVPITHAAQLSYQWQQWELNTQVRRFYGELLPSLGVSKYTSYGRFDANFDTRYKSLGLGWSNASFGVQLQSDNVNLGRAKVLGLGLHFNKQF